MQHYWIIENCKYCEGSGFDIEYYSGNFEEDKLCPDCRGTLLVAVKIVNCWINNLIYKNEKKFRLKKQAKKEIEEIYNYN